MEDVLDLYQAPPSEYYPSVCFDEKPVQLISEREAPLPCAPGETQRYDYEYVREGTRNLFVFFDPNAGWRHVNVTEHRTGLDFAEQMRYLVEECYPKARRIRVVLDNLNIHKLHWLYELFEAKHARAIARKIEFHYTPKHASWLNMVEVELSVLERQCLDRRIGTEEELKREIAAWERTRNEEKATVEWQFTTSKARKKLKNHYPSTPR